MMAKREQPSSVKQHERHGWGECTGYPVEGCSLLW